MKPVDAVELITRCAQIPSFSSFEERIHPFIREIAGMVPDAQLSFVPDNNILIRIPGDASRQTVCLAAHIDKINHFGGDRTEPLPIVQSDEKLTGLLDDSTGVGIVLATMLKAHTENYPPLLILLSEMEEGTGVRQTPDLLKNNGAGYYSGMGAERLSKALVAEGIVPSLIVTIDTTPLFRGEAGIALYSRHWEFNKIEPSQKLIDRTEHIEQWFTEHYPDVVKRNNTNDYLEYGKWFNQTPDSAVPSIAIEPAIFPYHCAEEGVFIADIRKTETILHALLADRNLV